MNPQAVQLNNQLNEFNPHAYNLLSRLGREIYFPKVGILNQSAEAKKQANKFNATIGIAIENKQPMHLECIQESLSSYAPSDLYPYAPPEGKPELRTAWRDKMLRENPSLHNVDFGRPIVTHALTHGLSVAADLFVDDGDCVIIPDKNWENYDLTFGIRRGARIINYPLYNSEGKFNAEGLKQAILAQQERGKAIVVLNFPNNPTGYTPTIAEVHAIIAAIESGAEAGISQTIIIDDAYFGLFFEDSIQESIFGKIIGLHPRVLPVKIDGATKEEFVWGFRVGFITFGASHQGINDLLEQKAIGIIRGTISSCSHPSQTFVLKALLHPNFESQRQEKVKLLKSRANRVKQLLTSGKYDDAWTYYPFNSGYFMCLQLKLVHAESLRLHLLQQFGVGTIALGETDLRVAFSCIEERDLEQLFDLIYLGAKQLENSHS
jgi:aspartate/methionine/tyrosine aminotransferase